MTSFLLVDSARAKVFSNLDRIRYLLRSSTTWTDSQGGWWSGVQFGSSGVAVSSLGPGWFFDPFARQQRAVPYEARRQMMNRANDTQHQQELIAAIGQLRLGSHAERLLWVIHQTVIGSRQSVVQIPDELFGRSVWGSERGTWPRHWRRNILATLRGLAWLHAADWPNRGMPILGDATVLLVHVADLRHTASDDCDEHCPGRHGPPHHHFLVNIGRGFLGVLEQFAQPDDGSGVRHFNFPARRSSGGEITLRTIGRTGRLVQVFTPAKTGEPQACSRFTKTQHRLLQAIVRETTRASKNRRNDVAATEEFRGNRVRGISGRSMLTCPLLDADGQYTGFNGNKIRKGQGYRLSTPGGWLAKAGYSADDVQAFLQDLSALSTPLGLIVAGIIPRSGEWLDRTALQSQVVSTRGAGVLDRVHLRIYTCADFVERWTRVFQPVVLPSEVPDCRQIDHAGEMVAQMSRKRIRRRALALAIGADPSFVSKLLSGKKPWPQDLLEQAHVWVSAQPLLPAARLDATNAVLADSGQSVLAIGLALLERGWSVLPQRTAAKKPLVRWKQFQEQQPSVDQFTGWFQQWPDAGLVVILGPVSDLFVIDVDGEDAHRILIERLGSEPSAPKVLSGSREPNRYHLFFRHPALSTKAKATPWHPHLEFRGNRGIVVLPPSRHKSGNQYAWAPGQSLVDLPLSNVPAEVLTSLVPPPRAIAVVAQPVPAGLVVSPSTHRFLEGRHANGPRWNERLFLAACDLAGRNIPLEVAQPMLLAGAQPWNAGEAEAAQRTVRSAYSQRRMPAVL